MSRRNPPAIPADTTEDVWRLQMAAIAQRSVADRLDEWAELNRAVARMEADGIRRRHPAPRPVIDLAAAFAAVAVALERSGLDHVVVGSTTAAGWGVARTTRDVDLVVQFDSGAAKTFLASLDCDGRAPW